eukprot:2935354-Amphidinium_carterae.1
MVIGDSSAQQSAEALAALVALRLWRPVWHHERLSLTFRSDSMAVLHLLSNLRSKSFKFNLIA